MIRAAVSGFVDFSEAELRNPAWHRRLQLVLRETARRARIEQQQARMLYLLPIVAATASTNNETLQKLFFETYQSWSDLLAPGETKEQQQKRRKSATAASISLWEKAYGKMDDPEVQERIQKTVASLEAAKHTQTKSGPRPALGGFS